MSGGAKQSADRFLGRDYRGKEVADGVQQQSGPEVTAALRNGSPDTSGRRQSSGADRPTSSGDGAGDPPSPPAGGRPGAADDEPHIRLDLGGPGSPALRADAVGAASARNSLTAALRDWSAPGYVDDIANAVGDVVGHGRGTVRLTAETVGRTDGSRLLRIEVTHTDAGRVRTTWELDRTPRTVERVVPGPGSTPQPERAAGADGDDRRTPLWESVYQDYQKGVGEVRRAMARGLADNYPWLTPAQIDDAKLIISELYTNAVAYSPDHRGRVDVTAPEDGRVRISVTNAMGPGDALKMADWVPDQQSVERQGGRGTQLAHALSAACGRDLHFGTESSSATHWFELHRSGESSGSDPVIDMSELAGDLADLGIDLDDLRPDGEK
ncbi:ATP-binding protein [Nocardia sp. NPDC002869]|uniref:ATP-binding protein n=1 Tax=Nocardia sp. NPDC002869 TaxID=3161032 RepID=UPI00398D325B